MSWTTVYLLPFIKNKILKNIFLFYIWRHQRYTIRRFRRVVSHSVTNTSDKSLELETGFYVYQIFAWKKVLTISLRSLNSLAPLPGGDRKPLQPLQSPLKAIDLAPSIFWRCFFYHCLSVQPPILMTHDHTSLVPRERWGTLLLHIRL